MARTLGIDIDDGIVRGALVSAGFRRTEVGGLFSERYGEEEGALEEAIRHLVGQIQPPPDGVIVALSGRVASLRRLTLPTAAARRVQEILPFELESLTPFELEDVVVSYQEVERDDDGQTLLAASAPRLEVRRCLDVLQAAGADPRAVTLSAVALEGLLPLLHPELAEANQLLINLRRQETDLLMVSEGRAHFARTLSIGADDLGDPKCVSRFETEVRRSLSGFRAAGAPMASHFTLVGEILDPTEANQWMSRVLELPSRDLALPLALSELNPRPFALALALGGRNLKRSRRLDFRVGDLARARAAGALRRHSRLAVAAAIAIAASAIFALVAQRSYERERATRLQQQLELRARSLLGKRLKSPDAVEAAIKASSAGMGPLPRFDAFSALDAVSKSISTEIRHDTRRFRVEIDDENRSGKLFIEGNVESVAEQERIAAAFEKQKCFTEVTKGDTSPAGPGKEGIIYSVGAVLQCGPAREAETSSRRSRRRQRARAR